MKRLDSAVARAALQHLPEWRYDAAKDAIAREFKFDGFREAFAFMTMIALAAEKRDHHPEWSNVYNRVAIMWTTHDAGGLTAMDVELARLCDAAFSRFAAAGHG